MQGRTLSALAIVTLLVLASAGAETATRQTRVVERLVGTPSPLGPVLVLSDQTSWRVDNAGDTVVLIDAKADPPALFYLRVHRLDEPEPVVAYPGAHLSHLISAPGSWRVVVDPAGGAAVKVTVTFRGHVTDVDGAHASFTLTDLEKAGGCVVPGVCLP